MSISALEAKAAGKRQIEVSEDSEFQNRLLSNGGPLNTQRPSRCAVRFDFSHCG